jgi:hypothetical protein
MSHKDRGRNRRRLNRIVTIASVALAGAAIVREIRKPSEDRTWHGTVAGVPYDLRPPTLGRAKRRWWNWDDPRIFTPKTFGVGWDLNIAGIIRLVRGVVRPSAG